MTKPDAVLSHLRLNVGKLVRDHDLADAAHCSQGSLGNHVSRLRSLGHVIDRHRQCGWIYVGQRGRAMSTHRDDEMSIGEHWRPEHRGDPLLDRLIEVHGLDYANRDIFS